MPWFLNHIFLPLLQFQNKECYHELRFEKNSRYYVIRLSKDLLGDWVITLINGRIKSKLGQVRGLAFASFDEGFEHLCAMAKLRTQRRYLLKVMTCDCDLMLHLLSYLMSIKNSNQLPEENSINKVKRRVRPNTHKTIVSNHRIKPIVPQQLFFSF